MQRDQAHRTNELLERIAKALEKNTANVVYNGELKNTKDIPGFEGTLEDLHNLKLHTDEGPDSSYDDDIHNDYLNDLVADMNQIEYSNFHRDLSCSFAQNDATEMTNFIYELEYEECLGAIKTALLIKGDNDYVDAVECSGFDKERKDELAREYVIDLIKEENTTDPIGDYANDPNLEVQMNQDEYLNANQGSVNQDDPYTYDNNLREYLDGVINDSDHNIRKTAYSYDAAIDEDLHTKKDCILDYVTNEFGTFGARYTDVIKFAYYLGSPNAPKYTSANRGYYSIAFSPRMNGHLIKGGKDYLVKGINNEGNERYFAESFVESATDYWKRII